VLALKKETSYLLIIKLYRNVALLAYYIIGRSYICNWVPTD